MPNDVQYFRLGLIDDLERSRVPAGRQQTYRLPSRAPSQRRHLERRRHKIDQELYGFASPSVVEPQHVEYRPIAQHGQTPKCVNCAKSAKWFASRIRVSRMRSRAIP
jgi:hypothetical protein